VVVVAGSGDQFLWNDAGSAWQWRLSAYLDSSEGLNVRVDTGAGSYVTSTGTPALSAGRHSIIILADLTADGPTVYVDGQPYAISDWSSTPSAAVWDADTPNAQTMGDFSAGEGANWLGRVIALGLVPDGSLDADIAAKFHRDPTMWIAQNCASGDAEGWLINEGSGSTLNGLNGHDLTITGADWDLTANGAQNYLNADGAGDSFPAEGYFIRGVVPDNTIETAQFTQPGTTFTLLAVFTPHGYPDGHFEGIASHEQTLNPYPGPWLGYVLSGDKTIGGFCGHYSYASGDCAVSANNAIVLGKKQMAAVVVDGSNVRLWLDGAWASAPKAVVNYTPSSRRLCVGRSYVGAYHPNRPKIYTERAALYNRVLTTGELNRIAKQHGVGG